MLRAGLEGTLTFDQIESASPELIVARRKAKNSRSLSTRYQLRLVRVQSAAKTAGPSAVFCSDRTYCRGVEHPLAETRCAMDAIHHSGAGLVLVATRPGMAEALGCVAGPVQWLPTPRPGQRGRGEAWEMVPKDGCSQSMSRLWEWVH